MANKYALVPATVQLASGASVFVDAGSLWASGSAVVTAAPAIFTSAITLGATTVAAPNPNPVPVSITISGGTVTAISISGGSSVGTSGTFTVPAGGTVAVTYSVAPTTFTTADIAPAAGNYGHGHFPHVNGVHAGYLAVHSGGPQIS